MTPATVSRANRRQSTFRCTTWLAADAAVVKLSTACTPADAAAGVTPRLSRSVLEMTPNAMPSAPSTSCAKKPTATNGSASRSEKVEKSNTRARAPAEWMLGSRRPRPKRAHHKGAHGEWRVANRCHFYDRLL